MTGSKVERPLKVAVVGTGRMGRQHITAIQRLPELAEVVAVVDANGARAAEVAGSHGVAHSYESIEDCLRSEQPDAVHVITPIGTHGPIVRASLAAGAHVYVEKPVADSLEEAREFAELAEKYGRVLWPGHQLLFEEPTRAATALLPRIGEVDHVESYFSFRQARPQDGTAPLSARDQLLDILPHPTYLLAWFLRAGGATSFQLAAPEVDDRGRFYSLVTTDGPRGILSVTLDGRPVDSFVRIVGSTGTLTVDYVRGTVFASLGKGTTIEKIVDPYARGIRLLTATTSALANRFLKKQRSYPGLKEAFAAFYQTIRGETRNPLSTADLLWTAEVGELAQQRLDADLARSETASWAPATVAVTGGTGFLGRQVVRALLQRGETPLVIVRRPPPLKRREEGAQYVVANLGIAPMDLPSSVHTVMHCAAETVGGWDAHQRNSVDATRNLIESMSRASIRRLIHVSSIAVLDAAARGPLDEDTPLESNERGRGPYVWGKLESERLVTAAAERGEIDARIVRPTALVDRADFDAPGRLGRALAGLFVAVGPASATLATCDVRFAADVMVRVMDHFEEAPVLLNLLDVPSPTRRELVTQLRDMGFRAVWLPWPVLKVMSGTLIGVQKVLKPRKKAMDVASAFGSPQYSSERLQAFLAVGGEHQAESTEAFVAAASAG